MLLSSPKAYADHVIGEDMAIMPINKPFANFLVVLNSYIDEKTRHNSSKEMYQVIQIYRISDGKLITQVDVIANTAPVDYLSFKNKECAALFGLEHYAVRYEREVFLDPDVYDDPQGYRLVHDKCCRAKDISSIVNSKDAAVSTILEFPSLKQNPGYASTEFQFPNGEYLCLNKPFQVSYMVRNPENKDLIFSLTEPLAGYTIDGAANINNPPAIFPGQPPVSWNAGFGTSSLMPASKPLSVDPKTGTVTVTPTKEGIYVFAVLVEEFENGVKTGSNRRDYTFIVKNCPGNPPAAPVITYRGNTVKELDVCAGAAVDLETPDNPAWNFQWQNNGVNIPGATMNRVSVSDTGTFTVVASLKNTCSAESNSEKFKVRLVSGSTPIKIVTNSKVACEGQTIKLETDDPAVIPDWYLGTQFLSFSKEVVAAQSGEYIVRKGGGQTNCPVVEDKVTLTFYPPPVLTTPDPAYPFCPDGSVFLETINDNDYRYQWFKDGNALTGTDAKRFRYEAKEKGNYTVRVDRAGILCNVLSAVFSVKYDPPCDPMNPQNMLHFPNSFTPNNDGENDVWEIINYHKCTDCMLIIFDGWGNKIFESKTFWDGRFNGKMVPVGRYNFILRSAKFGKKGSVMVLY
jgi:gliding motility-associated-like protein